MSDASPIFGHPYKVLNNCLPSKLRNEDGPQVLSCNPPYWRVSHLPLTGYGGIDAELWYACAGPQKRLPSVNSVVAYLPQGHIEQVSSFHIQNQEDGQIPCYNLPGVIPCILDNIQLNADPETDEVYATLTLGPFSGKPMDESDCIEPPVQPKQMPKGFTKTLTVSDTSTHGGFSVPRRAAEECLPALDMNQSPPTQELVAKDLHGKEWKFKHLFRGQPKRHLFTTGWSVFVSTKRLAAGDAVLFLSGENGQLRVGVRRAPRQQQLQSKVLTSLTMTIGVLEAASHATSEKSRFSLIYNPRSCLSEFVIPYQKYLNAVKNNFTVGQRFKLRLESEDCPDPRYTGTIAGIADYDPAKWPGSVWRSLKVNWDEASSSERQERVSPWEIEPLTVCTGTLPQVRNRKRNRVCSEALKLEKKLSRGLCPIRHTSRPDSMQSSEIYIGVPGAGLLDLCGTTGLECNQQKLQLSFQQFRDSIDNPKDIGHTLSPRCSTLHSFGNPRSLSDLQLCASSPAQREHVGSEAMNSQQWTVKSTQQSLPLSNFQETFCPSLLIPQSEVWGSLPARNSPACTALSMSCLPPLGSGISSHPLTPKSYSGKIYVEQKAPHAMPVGTLQDEEQSNCKIFGVSFGRVSSTVSLQQSSLKRHFNDAHQSSKVLETLQTSLVLCSRTSITTNRKELEMLSPSEEDQDWQEEEVAGNTSEAVQEGGNGRTIDVNKFYGHNIR